MLKTEYMRRRMFLYTKAFNKGFGAAERNCIAVLRQLIIGEDVQHTITSYPLSFMVYVCVFETKRSPSLKTESFSGVPREYSNNTFELTRFLRQSNVLETIDYCLESKARITHELQTLLICLAHWHLTAFKRATRPVILHMELSQILMYRKFANFPLFRNDGALAGSLVNTKLVLAMIYYWRYHILHTFHGSLGVWDELQEQIIPCAWKRPVYETSEKVRPLSKKWKGLHGKFQH